jgi:lathosterol oxidase
MTSLILNSFGIALQDRNKKLEQYRSHKSYSGKLFDGNYYCNILLPENLSIHQPLINEYISTLLQTILFAFIIYFTLSTLSYLYFFKLKKEKFLPKLKGSYYILHDIKWSIYNIIGESFLVSLLRMTLPRYSFVYYDVSEYGYKYLVLSIILHIVFDETFTYWIHRIFHTNRFLYRHLHEIHHKSEDITPFSGFAFHPIDAFGQAVPTFFSCYFFPIHYDVVLFFSLITTIWAISIHDNVPALPIKLFMYSTHHTIHHEKGIGKFRNYGKFTSVWDRLAGTYMDPDKIDYGWKRNQEFTKFFEKINFFIDIYIPDITKNKKKIS